MSDGNESWIPQLPPYEFTGLTSAVEREQPDPTKRFVGIYYQEPDGSIQKVLQSFGFHQFFGLPPTTALKLGTPLAAVAAETTEATQIYAVTADSSIIETFSDDVVVLKTLEDTKIAAITDNATTRVFYQPEGKENEIAQAIPGSLEKKTIVCNAIKGTNMGALETSLEKIDLLNFDRCLVYHGQDSNLYFWWTEGELPPQTEVIPAGSLLANSAVAVVRMTTKIIVYYLNENSELYYIVKSENFGFNWGEPQEVKNVAHKPRNGTALTAIISEEKKEILLSYQDTKSKIQTVHIKVPA